MNFFLLLKARHNQTTLTVRQQAHLAQEAHLHVPEGGMSLHLVPGTVAMLIWPETPP